MAVVRGPTAGGRGAAHADQARAEKLRRLCAAGGLFVAHDRSGTQAEPCFVWTADVSASHRWGRLSAARLSASFADHYRDPWYGHHAIGKAGLRDELAPSADEMFKDGEQSPWSNISHVVYQDSGASLNCSLRHSYQEKADRLRATLEFGRARNGDADDIEIMKTFDVEALPNGLVVIVPPDLESPKNIAILQRDRDFAEETGLFADAFAWPTIGRRPTRIPFFVSANIGGYELPVDAAVAREEKTLDNFGFNGDHSHTLHGLWIMKKDSYCRPDVDGMRERIKHEVEAFHKSGAQARRHRVLHVDGRTDRSIGVVHGAG